MRKDEPDYNRILTAIFLTAILLVGWQALVEWPRRQKLSHYHAEVTTQLNKEQEKYAEQGPAKETDAEDNPSLTRAQRLALSPRVSIASEKLHGSIALKGARFDDLTLARYRETLDPDSPEVTLFSPGGDEQAYFAQIGWISGDSKTKVPDQHTVWQADKKTLIPGDTVHLSWNNGEGVNFILDVSLDKDYMFSVTQHAENHSGQAISVTPYAYINRAYAEPKVQDYGGLHKGPLGVMGNGLVEVTYKDLHDKGNKKYENASGWFGITDKYWLSALIPAESGTTVTFSHYLKNGRDRFQTDYLGSPAQFDGDVSHAQTVRLFAGAKELNVLDCYSGVHWQWYSDKSCDNRQPAIPLFDRAIDFGFLYFLTKPLCELLNFLHTHTGNFAIAILLLTIIVKLALYPLASKAFKAGAQMRRLQPEIKKLQERYGEDMMTFNKERMALLKREKVSMASGCLPVLPQIFVFIALLKVLNVSIEMRHAPLFGWVHDLSAADPSNIFTAFGLINWTPPWGWMHIGLLPIIYSLSMFISMKQQPVAPDPTTAKTMKLMPIFMLVIFNSMPAGLVFYFIWSNLLTIVQQYVISKRHGVSQMSDVR